MSRIPFPVQALLVSCLLGLLALFLLADLSTPAAPSQKSQTASAAAATSTAAAATTPPAVTNTDQQTPEIASSTAIFQPSVEMPPSRKRIENPYATPPFSFADVNIATRLALVNILCSPRGGSLQPVSGSGVIIDPRGIILTNAHVAQYVLLSQSPRTDLSCTIRTGAPAMAQWHVNVLYMPSIWVEEHAKDIRTAKPVGTGEHDYALLSIGGPVHPSAPLPPFPYLSPDTREAVAFTGDTILAAGYPAEFLGGSTTHFDLYPVTSLSAVGQMYTFADDSVDAISLGGVIGAQSGSSGGGAVNAWQRLVGILTTTSDGATTAERDLRAITLSYIDRDMVAQTGKTLSEYLAEDPTVLTLRFAASDAGLLIRLLLEQLSI